MRLHPLLAVSSFALTLAVAGHAAPAANAPADVASARRALQAAVSQGTAQDIMAVRARFTAMVTTAPQSPWAHYWVALCDWRVAPRLGDKAKPLAEKTCNEGLAEIDKAIALLPREGEFHALRSNLLGMSLQFHPAAMMTIGPEIEAAMQRALMAAPNNPRVELFAGINTLNKPAFVGGGADHALPLFRRAQELFESATPADSTAPDWGRDDAWLWAGRAAMKQGDAATARACYMKALEITPGHAWVTHALLPEAEQALADGGAKRK
jgi:tetratricopeptide (TPR) repeat protein